MRERVLAAVHGLTSPRCGFVYDLAVLREQVGKVRSAFGGATVLYAMKANSHPAVVAALSGLCDGLDVASAGELELALAVGARRIVVSGPAKTDALLRAAVAAGAQINVESAHELRRLPPGAKVAIRVNRTGAALAGSHAMTGAPTQFGVDEDELPAVLALAAAEGVDVLGFHLHAVSNNLDAAAHARFVADALAWSATQPVDLRLVNVGGGLGVDHLSAATIDLDALREALPAPRPGVELIVEPGRILAADAGYYAAEVIDLKRSHGRWFAVLRGGTHHFRLPAAWGYSHPFDIVPVDEWPYPFPRPTVEEAEVDVAGELCTPRDVLARGRHVRRLRAGDVLVFGRAGAYGWDISHHDFLRHPHPEVIVLGPAGS